MTHEQKRQAAIENFRHWMIENDLRVMPNVAIVAGVRSYTYLLVHMHGSKKVNSARILASCEDKTPVPVCGLDAESVPLLY